MFINGVAYHRLEGTIAGPPIMFLPGYRSTMTGSKALALEEYCRTTGRAFVRFDYRGHGESTGDFLDLTLTDWVNDAAVVLDLLADDPPILVGSSMGAWIALLLAQQQQQRRLAVSGIVALAPAVDFTEDLYKSLTCHERKEMEESGILWRPSAYDVEPYPFTKRLVEDARQWLLLDKDTIGIDSTIPVHLIHGQRDEDIKWEKSIEIAEKIQHGNVVVSLVNGGDHRLSSPTDLQRMIAAIKSMI